MIAGIGALFIWHAPYHRRGRRPIDLFRAMLFRPLYSREIASGPMLLGMFWRALIMANLCDSTARESGLGVKKLLTLAQ